MPIFKMSRNTVSDEWLFTLFKMGSCVCKNLFVVLYVYPIAALVHCFAVAFIRLNYLFTSDLV